jgi:hypothetical protein
MSAHSISIQQLDNDTYRVTVDARSKTTHTVSVSNQYHQKLTGGSVSKDELVRRSFGFLLEREPNTSILTEFELSVIGRYFPEYEEEMRRGIG